ncbi:RsmE family RNA methyltransferase [Paenibacillus sp. 481]|uniref:RsmE family RNA methyltransferase n=1 Tax=Paenibacillus sp. 481 TaxID=2835869 RepID=UPI001E4EF070|nr:RsmE family RNA methyltransferase [Paenibacillus sp. 481]UHA75816.1 16S rRNA (uracil(1498)-N(3))-methyltransferase [Paenibacillus sp. 481]
MQKYFVAPSQFGEEHIDIEGNDAHHIMNVMRAKIGSSIEVSDGLAREALANIESYEEGVVRARIVEMRPLDRESVVHVTIAQSLPKGDKMETIIQKCTEIGAVRFVPFVSERTIVQYDAKKEAKRIERWGKIAKEAAEQSHRNRIPDIMSSLSWKQLIAQFSEYDRVLFCYEDERGTQLRDVVKPFAERLASDQTSIEAANKTQLDPLPNAKAPSVLVVVGPEGGFATREVEAALAAGARAVGLGRRILRAETAGMVATACIMYEFGEMGGL